MAYRTSDHLRWKQVTMWSAFVLVLSNKPTLLDRTVPHKFTDTATSWVHAQLYSERKMAVPKDFKFVGWHPHCVSRPVGAKNSRGMQEDTNAIFAGEETTSESVNRVTEFLGNLRVDCWKYRTSKIPKFLCLFILDNGSTFRIFHSF